MLLSIDDLTIRLLGATLLNLHFHNHIMYPIVKYTFLQLKIANRQNRLNAGAKLGTPPRVVQRDWQMCVTNRRNWVAVRHSAYLQHCA